MTRPQFDASFHSGVSFGWVTTLGSCRWSAHLSVTRNGNSRAWISVMNSSYDLADGCPKCVRLLSEYEAATFEQARIHNSLDIVQHCEDRLSSRVLKLEAYTITARRNGAHAAFLQHQEIEHRFADRIAMASATEQSAKEA